MVTFGVGLQNVFGWEIVAIFVARYEGSPGMMIFDKLSGSEL